MDFLDLDQVLDDALVVGAHHNLENCKAFYAAVQEAAEYGVIEDDIAIQIRREPNNEFDAYAIKVLGKWTTPEGKSKTAKLGYIHKDLAWKIAQDVSEDDKLYGEFSSIEPHQSFGFDIRVNVYVKYAF
ncbi:MAG: hypothetical protein M9944_07865 [Rhizobiaceae bacterium]|nr:hypothetical protein [Rhizobiaceae bacterium]